MKYRTKTSPILIHQSAGARGGAAFGSSCLSASGRMILASVVAALALLVPLATPHSAVADNIIENGNFDGAIDEDENDVRGGAVVLDPWLSVP
ncbi:MAG: hypothetical protein HRT46_11740, partial [Deltaproteobacteria bacterium]|nr:hypothetical protein [Deltaproteobacteria bacterium]